MGDGTPPFRLGGNGDREKIRDVLSRAAVRFTFSATPRLDAELLMAHALRVTREELLLCHLDAATPLAFAALIERRTRHEPIAYITGTRAFWTIDLAVGPGVLIPRADSETLIEAAVAHFAEKARGPRRILDLGTGPGTLLLAALAQWREATGLGIDISAEALAYAEVNARALGCADRAQWRLGNWGDALTERFDLILTNPPYVADGEPLPEEVRAHEPGIALFAGPDGLDAYRALAPVIGRLLEPGGLAAIEIGATQADAVTAVFAAQGCMTRLRHDLAGRPRALLVQT